MAKSTSQQKKVEKALEDFLAIVAKDGLAIRPAAKKAGIAVSTLYERKNNDAEYAARWDEAIEAANTRIEEEIYRRGVEGVEQDVWYLGEVVGQKLVYSDQCLLALAKARMKEYRVSRQELTGADGEPLTQPFNFDNLSLEEMKQIERLAEKAAQPSGD